MSSCRTGIDDRGVSETASVGILVGITLLMTMSVGVYVLAVGVDDGPTSANFSFDYDSTADSLLVRHADGDPLVAGNLSIESGSTRVGWAAIANSGANDTVEPGDAVLLSENSEWGRAVAGDSRIRVLYDVEGNGTELSRWSGVSSDFGPTL